MIIGDNVRSYLENNIEKDREELIKGLSNIFDYNPELATRIYTIWRQIYRLDDYKSIESSFTEKEKATLHKLDEIYKENLKKIHWW